MIKDLFKDALPILETVTPIIAKLIGGYPAIAAEYLLPELVKAAGIHTGDVGQLVRDIVNKPETQSALQQFEQTHSDSLNGILSNVNNISSAEFNVKLNFQKPECPV